MFTTGTKAIVLAAGMTLLGACSSTEETHMSSGVQSMDFDRARNQPPSPETLYRMARVLSAQGKDEKAAATLRTAIRQYPKYGPAYSDLAALQMRHDRHPDAEMTLMEAVRVNPENAELHNHLGMCRLMMDHYDNAQHAFAQASTLDPDNTQYIGNQALAAGMRGDYDEALEIYESFLGPVDAHYNLGVICEALGDHERAAFEFMVANSGGVVPEQQAAIEDESWPEGNEHD